MARCRAALTADFDLVAISAHKFGGPKGVGALVVRDRARASLRPLLRGGAQEAELRAGTENLAGIVASGAAAAACGPSARRRSSHACGSLRDRLEDALSRGAGRDLGCAAGSGGCRSLPLQLRGVATEELLMLLDAAGVQASAGAACASGALLPSHVLVGDGLDRTTRSRARSDSRSAGRRPQTRSTGRFVDPGDRFVAARRRVGKNLGMRVLVAMSGGVDSSVAAALEKEAGHEVVGATMKLWGGDSDSGCCSLADVTDARRVCDHLGIEHHVFNFTAEFDHHVVDAYAQAHSVGKTPNPCVECNRHLKFDAFLARASRLGFDAIATGHHARVLRTGERACGIAQGA